MPSERSSPSGGWREVADAMEVDPDGHEADSLAERAERADEYAAARDAASVDDEAAAGTASRGDEAAVDGDSVNDEATPDRRAATDGGAERIPADRPAWLEPCPDCGAVAGIDPDDVCCEAHRERLRRARADDD